MPRIRCTFFFTQNKAGWTETFYSTKDTLDAAKQDCMGLVPLSVRLRGSDTALEYVRVSDDEVARDADNFAISEDDSKNRFVAAGESDFSNTGVIVQLRAGPLGSRSLTMRGIPDDIVVLGGKFLGKARWINAFNAWKAFLINKFAIRGKNPLNERWAINQIVNDPITNKTEINVGFAHGVLPGELVQLGGNLGTPQLRGIKRVLSVTGNSMTFATPYIVKPQAGFCWARKVGYVLRPIVDATPIRISSRKAGRPLGSPVGRR